MKQAGSVKLLLSAALLLVSLWKASSFNHRMCEGYAGEEGRYHLGFYCPRLSDPPQHMHCCRRGNESLKYCCSQREFELLMRVNLSEVLATSVHRSPLPLLGVGFYGLLILFLMIVDFLYYYRLNQQTFYNMISHRWLGKQLVSSLLRRNSDTFPHQGHKGFRGARGNSLKAPRQACAPAVPDIKCET
ncbi:protein shisa-like-1a isoform X2 [Rhinatrema bivittatum]|uniref:protein shisa-like-1a isoform X2 n=1 Tax=Rhinatrema bivittatum TaxID=194408 RepID=UPI001129C855|nr:protein shisa-like-1a isoform X2 [Rhinatrema bivittatum]XP_029431683.1 protein shisa-like-1a isoform X2 [Rhinatrema bivittatum]